MEYDVYFPIHNAMIERRVPKEWNLTYKWTLWEGDRMIELLRLEKASKIIMSNYHHCAQ